MLFNLQTTDNKHVLTQTSFDSLRSAYVAYETALNDNRIVKASLWVEGFATPLAGFDRNSVVRNVYNIIG